MFVRTELNATANNSQVERFYRQALANHDFFSQRQVGEGGCVPTNVAHFLRLNDGRWGLSSGNLFKELGTTASGGVSDGSLEYFLSSNKIAHFISAEWPISEIKKLLNQLPPGAMMLTSFWDTRVRPGYTPQTDPPEEHVLWLREIIPFNGRWLAIAWDSDSMIGGQIITPIEELHAFWHDGPDSKLLGHVVEKSQNIGWFVVLGVKERWVRQTIGHPERFMIGTNINKRTKITNSGRLVFI